MGIFKKVCSFCGVYAKDSFIMLASELYPSIMVCNMCVKDLVAMVTYLEGKHLAPSSTPESEPLTAQAIKNVLDKHIIGQDQAKKLLSVAVQTHYRLLKNKLSTTNMKKSCVLLIGPTGCGKTLLAETLAKIVEVPFAAIDITHYTEAGYIGSKLQGIPNLLVAAANGDIEKAKKGIIYIDEIDKLATSHGSGKVLPHNKDGVQHQLLKFIEGTKFIVGHERQMSVGQKEYEFDTTNVLFILGGAFSGLKDLEVYTPKKAGFVKDISEKDELQEQLYLKTDLLIDYGLIPEFVGRISTIAELKALTKSDMLSILKDVDDSLLKFYTHLFKMEDVTLTFAEDGLNEIVKIALKRKVGARGLKTILELVLNDFLFDSFSLKGQKLVITKKLVIEKCTV